MGKNRKAIEKRQQQRKRAQGLKRAGKPHSAPQRAAMTRNVDLQYLEDQIKDYVAEMEGVKATYAEYAQKEHQAIQAILAEAGVLDPIKEIEQRREEVRKTAQQQLNDLETKIRDALKIRDFLQTRPSHNTVGPEGTEGTTELVVVEDGEQEGDEVAPAPDTTPAGVAGV